ncbi:MAG: PDZ domain-containing protein [Nitrosomonadaceae bacterium]
MEKEVKTTKNKAKEIKNPENRDEKPTSRILHSDKWVINHKWLISIFVLTMGVSGFFSYAAATNTLSALLESDRLLFHEIELCSKERELDKLAFTEGREIFKKQVEAHVDTVSRIESIISRIESIISMIESKFSMIESIISMIESKFSMIEKSIVFLSHYHLKFGFSHADLTEKTRLYYKRNTGVVVTNVYKGTPLFYANIIKGDLIIGIDGIEVRNKEDLSAYVQIIYAKDSKECTLTFIRDSVEKQILIKLRHNTGRLD